MLSAFRVFNPFVIEVGPANFSLDGVAFEKDYAFHDVAISLCNSVDLCVSVVKGIYHRESQREKLTAKVLNFKPSYGHPNSPGNARRSRSLDRDRACRQTSLGLSGKLDRTLERRSHNHARFYFEPRSLRRGYR